MAQMLGGASWATIAGNSGGIGECIPMGGRVAMPHTLTSQTREECPDWARSCSRMGWDGCCVPHHGYLVLAMQWHPRLRDNRDFTIHGFWPNPCMRGVDISDGCDPHKVQRDVTTSLPRVGTLTRELHSNWPSYTMPNPAFWTLEYNKHGTCLSTIDDTCPTLRKYPGATNEVARYFRLTLDQYYRYNVRLELAQSSERIVPGAQYTKAKFVTALNNWAGMFSLHCDDINTRANVGTLAEVRLYFVGGANNRFFMKQTRSSGNCPDNIFFPMKLAPTPSRG